MHKFVLALIMTLSASLLIISACALAEKAQEDKKKDCNEQVNPKSVGIGIFGIGIGQIGGKSDEGKASKECRSAKAVKTEKTAQQKK